MRLRPVRPDRIEVFLDGKPAGAAVPFTVGRTATPRPAPRRAARPEAAPTGIDYLGALGDGHDAALRDQVSYQFLAGGPRDEPGQQGEPEQEEGNEGGSRG